MARFSRLQREAFADMEDHFRRPVALISVADLKPDPELASMIGLPNGHYGPPPHTADQHRRLLYQAYLIHGLGKAPVQAMTAQPNQHSRGSRNSAA